MTDLDELLDKQPIAEPLTGAKGKVCTRHDWVKADGGYQGGTRTFVEFCRRCQKPKDLVRSKRGATSRSYGNRAELKVARKYGGEKVGQYGGPADVMGKDFQTQVKTHRRRPPTEWTTAINAMREGNRIPRLLVRFVQAGLPPDDWFVFRAEDFLAWFGKDE